MSTRISSRAESFTQGNLQRWPNTQLYWEQDFEEEALQEEGLQVANELDAELENVGSARKSLLKRLSSFALKALGIRKR